MPGIIAYYRVSTRKQGDSGLGLEGQAAAVQGYAGSMQRPILAAYTEVETGKIADRPELAKALAHARRAKATLVVAKLDRLARNVQFTSTLLRSGADFMACDNPNANKLTIHILAAVAEDEAERISARTKAALQAAKARGEQLGSCRPGHWEGREQARLNGLTKARERSAEVAGERARQAYADLVPSMQEMRRTGLTLARIAKALTEEGHTTRQGKAWNPSQVARVLAEAGK